jgi:hypothetical protein
VSGHADIGLREESVSFLEKVYRPDAALFPFSTSVESGRYVNDYGPPETLRYTINTLLGLQQSARTDVGPEPERVRAMVDSFLERQYANITSYADLGLLLVLLQDRPEDSRARDALRRIADAIASGGARVLNMQALGWMLWGLTAVAHTEASAELSAAALFRLIKHEFVAPGSLLPRHSVRAYRRRLVSFGATVYFLRAMSEYAALTGDESARALFEDGVRRMIDIQGPNGEWPWLIDPASGRAVELYPVFAVHQDSMAPLFLLPALDASLPGARQALVRSFAWTLGRNELGRPMYEDRPFRAYRSIYRAEPFPRALRLPRALVNVVLRRSTSLAGGRRVRINPECRSYHLGWILYAWSSRQELLEEVLRAARGVAIEREVSAA